MMLSILREPGRRARKEASVSRRLCGLLLTAFALLHRSKHFGKSLLATAVIAASLTPAVGGKSKSTEKPKTVQFRLPFWLGSSAAEPEAPLSASDLKIIAGKVPVTLSSLKAPDSPALLFVAFDTVGDISNINQARSTVVNEINSLGPQYWAGLISAGEQM